jgi:GNAT superfamily N-acetyltransferase
MLAVSKEYRKRKIGSTLVLMAIEAMKSAGADEVDPPPHQKKQKKNNNNNNNNNNNAVHPYTDTHAHMARQKHYPFFFYATSKVRR